MVSARPTTERREFLRRLGGGFGTLAFGALSGAFGAAGARAVVAAPGPLRPLAARPAPMPPRATSVIFLFLVGGPSQIDTFDRKPLLQRLDGQPLPAAIRRSIESSSHANVLHGCDDRLLASPYRWQRHGGSGMWVSELFPNLAERVDDLCFIHSMQADSNNHAPASYQMHTGDVRAGKASLGSWTTWGLGSESEDLPGYVVLFDAGPLGGPANYSSGFLPAAHQPTRLRDRGTPVLDLLPPADRALLDHLAERFLRDGWSVKRLVRYVALSGSYRQASAGAAGHFALRQPRRLSAEQLRDAMLQVSGLLDSKRDGPPVWPELPPEVLDSNPAFLDDNAEKTKGWYPSPPEARHCRSLFLVQKRNTRVPLLEAFDLPDNSVPCARRGVSTTPPQALMLLNGPLTIEASRAWAERVAREAGADPPARIARVFALAFQRAPEPEEIEACLRLAESRGLAEVCRAILNVNEFVSVE